MDMLSQGPIGRFISSFSSKPFLNEYKTDCSFSISDSSASYPANVGDNGNIGSSMAFSIGTYDSANARWPLSVNVYGQPSDTTTTNLLFTYVGAGSPLYLVCPNDSRYTNNIVVSHFSSYRFFFSI